jgi:hypothetical protein
MELSAIEKVVLLWQVQNVSCGKIKEIKENDN